MHTPLDMPEMRRSSWKRVVALARGSVEFGVAEGGEVVSHEVQEAAIVLYFEEGFTVDFQDS